MTLQQYLHANGLSQSAFAAAMGAAPSTVHRYLTGEIAPTLAQMARIAEITGGAVRPNDWLTVAHPDARVGGV